MKKVNALKKEVKRVTFFFIGLMLMSLGSVHMIKVSSLGVQPFDVLYIGLHEKISISIGTASILTGILLLSLSFLLTKEKLKIGTFLDTVCLGSFIDLFLYLDFVQTPTTLVWKICFLMFGTILISFGAALTIFSNLGAGPIDTFMLAIHKKFKLSVKVATTILEVFALVVGLFLGGPLGLGTILFCLLIGPLIEFSLNVLNKKEVTIFVHSTKKAS